MRSIRLSLETIAMIVCGLYAKPLKIAIPVRKSALAGCSSGKVVILATQSSNHASLARLAGGCIKGANGNKPAYPLSSTARPSSHGCNL